MKKFSFVFGIIAMIMFAFGFSSCEKESALQNSENSPEYGNKNCEFSQENPVDSVNFFGIESTRQYFGTCIADNLSQSAQGTFNAAAGSSYYIRVNGDRIPPLYFYVQNTTSSPITVKAYLGGPTTYTLYQSQSISSYAGSLFTFVGPEVYACYPYLVIQITNYNSTAVNGILWHANFID